MRARFGSLAALVAMLPLALPVSGQDADPRPPGWIGISFEVRSERSRRPRVEITSVSPGSPAQRAGVREGDRLVAVNDYDRTSELRSLSPEQLHLHAGDAVRMVVERDGRRHELHVRAEPRPDAFVASRELTWSFEPDSMVETMARAMDSLRIRIESRDSDVRVVRQSRSDGSSQRIRVVTTEEASGVRAPFEFFVFRGEETEELRAEAERLNTVIASLERQIEVSSRELRRSSTRVSRASRSRESLELERLREELAAALERSAALEVEMAEEAREMAGFQYTAPRAPAPVDAVEPVRARTEFRPLTPYLLGRNRVAGAEVIDLRPELAAYFQGVERGVLVVDVAPRTPASISGIVPGDVIVRMDQVTVRTVEDLRFGVSQAGVTLPLTLIRRGSSIQVLLRR